MTLPFTPDQFVDVCAAYLRWSTTARNRSNGG
jgi:hypothetical protein